MDHDRSYWRMIRSIQCLISWYSFGHDQLLIICLVILLTMFGHVWYMNDGLMMINSASGYALVD